jgi:hypothetical protein
VQPERLGPSSVDRRYGGDFAMLRAIGCTILVLALIGLLALIGVFKIFS